MASGVGTNLLITAAPGTGKTTVLRWDVQLDEMRRDEEGLRIHAHGAPRKPQAAASRPRALPLHTLPGQAGFSLISISARM